MNKIERQDLVQLILKKYNVIGDDYKIVEKVVDEIYDIQRESILPLTKEETFIFRKRYGVLDQGIPYSKEKIAKEYNIGYVKIQRILNIASTKLSFRINKIEKRNKVEKMSSFDIADKDDILVMDFKISNYLRNSLFKNNIYTLRELLEYSRQDLKQLLSDRDRNEVIKYVHSLGFLFLDELTLAEKANIIMNSSNDKVNNSSIYWLYGIRNLDPRSIKNVKFDNIGEYLHNDDKLENAKPKNIALENVQDNSLDNYSYEELLNLDIRKLEISKITLNILDDLGVKKIGEIVSLEKKDLKRIPRLGDVRIRELVETLHGLGLVFKDEALKMYNYSTTIEDEMKKSR